jgi:hypothetical protein
MGGLVAATWLLPTLYGWSLAIDDEVDVAGVRRLGRSRERLAEAFEVRGRALPEEQRADGIAPFEAVEQRLLVGGLSEHPALEDGDAQAAFARPAKELFDGDPIGSRGRLHAPGCRWASRAIRLRSSLGGHDGERNLAIAAR